MRPALFSKKDNFAVQNMILVQTTSLSYQLLLVYLIIVFFKFAGNYVTHIATQVSMTILHVFHH